MATQCMNGLHDKNAISKILDMWIILWLLSYFITSFKNVEFWRFRDNNN